MLQRSLPPPRTIPGICAALLLVFSCACTLISRKPQQVEFGELVGNPGQYADQPVCTQGVYLSAFEVNALSAGTYTQGDTVYLSEPSIWLEGAEITTQGDCATLDLGPPAVFCPVEACGTFETGGGFGHLGGWELQLSALER